MITLNFEMPASEYFTTSEIEMVQKYWEFVDGNFPCSPTYIKQANNITQDRLSSIVKSVIAPTINFTWQLVHSISALLFLVCSFPLRIKIGLPLQKGHGLISLFIIFQV